MIARKNWNLESQWMFSATRGFKARAGFLHVLSCAELRSSLPVRLPQPMRAAALPSKNGEDLVSCLLYLRETHRDRFEAIEDALCTAFPGFERLHFRPMAAGTLAMSWRDRNFSKPLYMNQVSEGMLRFLWLVTLFAKPRADCLDSDRRTGGQHPPNS